MHTVLQDVLHTFVSGVGVAAWLYETPAQYQWMLWWEALSVGV